MRHTAIVFALALLCLPAAAGAICGYEAILLMHDIGEYECCSVPVPEEPFTLYLVIQQDWPSYPITDASGIRLVDWVMEPDPALGEVAYTWSTDDIQGDLATGMTMHWDEPLQPALPHYGRHDFYILGTLEIVVHDPDWLYHEGYYLAPGAEFRDSWGDTFDHEVQEGSFWFWECDLVTICVDTNIDPGPLQFYVDHISPGDESIVPLDFDLEFDVYHQRCYWSNNEGFWGEILVAGAQVHEFDGYQYAHIDLQIHLDGYGHGDPVELTIHCWDNSQPVVHEYRELHYTVDAVTSAPPPALDPTSFSVLKARY